MGAIHAFKPRKDMHDRFMSKVEFDLNGGCWLWAGSDDGGAGYGRFRAEVALGTRQAHRAAYALFCEPIPDGMEIDHKCRVTACVNPDHLEPVTREENMRRAPKLGLALGGLANGARQRAKTHCPKGHDYAENLYVTPQGWRNCKECGRIKSRRQQAEKRAKSNA